MLKNDFDMSGLDIFQRRGGWYNNPRLKKTTPWCRHIWSQEVVRIQKQ
jgi:hypothetical protein